MSRWALRVPTTCFRELSPTNGRMKMRTRGDQERDHHSATPILSRLCQCNTNRAASIRERRCVKCRHTLLLLSHQSNAQLETFFISPVHVDPNHGNRRSPISSHTCSSDAYSNTFQAKHASDFLFTFLLGSNKCDCNSQARAARHPTRRLPHQLCVPIGLHHLQPVSACVLRHSALPPGVQLQRS